MIKKFVDWTKNNKIATIIIFVLLVAVVYKRNPYLFRMGITGYDNRTDYFESNEAGDMTLAVPSAAKMGSGVRFPSPIPQYPINLEVADRKVLSQGSLSLQVKNVGDSVEQIKTTVAQMNGYVVSVYTSRPEFGENANITVRVPADKVEDFLSFARQHAVKVVSETLSGTDITDQYIDTETRLAQMEEQKNMLETILRSARTVDEIMKVRPYLTQVQTEIDNMKGQIKYMEGASATALITMHLSTDELSLPYQPEQSWRPSVIFKNAVRSLLGTLQTVGSGVIWLGVYSVIVVPVLTILFIIYMVKRRRQ